LDEARRVTSIEIRAENSADHEAIHTITEMSFRGMPYADGDEQDLINRLRTVGALTLSLVAVAEGVVVGHIAFSPVNAMDESQPWFALGPVSVLPDRQGKGIGSALIEQGLTHIRGLGALGCILTGNPAYYRRFGFELAPQNAPPDEPQEFFMLKLFAPGAARSTLHFHDSFYADD